VVTPRFGFERSVGRGDRGVDLHPARRAQEWEVGRREEWDRIRAEGVVGRGRYAQGAMESVAVVAGRLLFQRAGLCVAIFWGDPV